MNEQQKKNLEFFYGSKPQQFSLLNLPAIFMDSTQNSVVRSLAHLAGSELYCNTGSILLQMTDKELYQTMTLFRDSEKELEPYLSGEKTLAESYNLNSISMFCFILARLEGEIEIKQGVLQNAFRKIGVLLQQEINYRKTKKNKPNYAKMSVLS